MSNIIAFIAGILIGIIISHKQEKYEHPIVTNYKHRMKDELTKDNYKIFEAVEDDLDTNNFRVEAMEKYHAPTQ